MTGRWMVGLALAASMPVALGAQDVSPAAMAIGRATAARYDSAFAVLEAKARADSQRYAPLLELAAFRREHVAWGVEEKGRYFALRSARARGWTVVVPATDPAYAGMGSVLEYDQGASMPATRVKEDTIAFEWTAIFLAYELSHLRDEVLQLLPSSAKPSQFAASSRRAYGAEVLAARATGGPPLLAFVDSVLEAARPKSAMALAEGMLPVLRASFDAFDALITDQRALTEREEQRRAGVYAAALLLRYVELRGLGDEAFSEAMRCVGGCPR